MGMKALVKTRPGVGNAGIVDVPVPRIGHAEVLIKVHYCGICGTDIHILNDEFKNEPPVILGHEFSGEIVRIGSNVRGWKIGERVVCELHARACRRCYLCLGGNFHVCPRKKIIGAQVDGAFAEYTKVPSWLLHSIPANVPYEFAAITEPTAICCHALYQRTNVGSADCVVIFGAGPIGIIATMILRSAGVKRIILAGTSSDEKVRFRIARDAGAHEVINVQRENLWRVVSSRTNGRGADMIIEASGSVSAIDAAMEVVRKKGSIVVLGVTKEDNIPVGWHRGMFKEIDLLFSFSSNHADWERALNLISRGKVLANKIISNVIPLNDWQKGFEMLASGMVVKTLIKISR
jgi:L-iditol 2-dehydrogenase